MWRVRQLSWREVWWRRLERHRLIEPAPLDQLTEVVRDVCGIHAQVMTSAELSLGLRVADITQRDVRRALWDERTLVKTYGPRSTVHLFASDDLPTWLAALQAAPPPRPPTSTSSTSSLPTRCSQLLRRCAMRSRSSAHAPAAGDRARTAARRVGAGRGVAGVRRHVAALAASAERRRAAGRDRVRAEPGHARDLRTRRPVARASIARRR